MEDIMLGMAEDIMMEEILGIVNQFSSFLVILMIPTLLIGVAYCFFGIKIYRFLVAIAGGCIGLMLGAALGGIATDSAAGFVIGLILGAALFGFLAWKFYMVFLFIQSFMIGLSACTILFTLLGGFGGIKPGMIIGILVGIALGVLTCIYAKWVIMGTTAYSGASSIAMALAMAFVGISTSYRIWYILLLIIFTVGGFYVQYRLEMQTPFAAGGSVHFSKPNIKFKTKNHYVLLGIDGLYKGFEFDLLHNMVFGRDEDCNVLYPESSNGVSKVQCEFEVNPSNGTLAVIDKYSSYGTSINGQRLSNNTSVSLKDGDIVMFGENNVFKVKKS